MATQSKQLDLPAMAAKPLGAGSAAPSLEGTSPASPLFITTSSCPYAQRTWLALEEAGLAYTPVFVDLKQKAEWHLAHNPFGRVPTLAWTAAASPPASSSPAAAAASATQSLYESLVCNEFVNDVSGGKLLPRGGGDPAAAAGARLLIDQFSQKFGPAFAGLMFSEDGGDKASEAAGKMDEALAFLEANTADGGGSAAAADGAPPRAPLFLLGGDGGAFTLADAAIYPFLARLAHALPRLSPLSAGKYGDLAAAGFPRVGAWLARTAARPGVRRTEVAPQGASGYWAAMHETYVEYRARQRAAMAAVAAAK